MDRLYLMRHAKAEQTAPGGNDADRTLISHGESQSASVGAALLELDEIPLAFASSPLIRAVQTASIVATAIDGGAKVLKSDALAPGFDPAEAAEWLGGLDVSSALIVSHAPSIGNFASWLLAGDARLEIHYQTGAIMCVTLDGGVQPGAATLEWFIVSEQCARIAQ